MGGMLFIPSLGFSQNSTNASSIERQEDSTDSIQPKGFGSIKLGADYSSVVELLTKSPNFRYRKSSLSWNGDSSTIAADGRGFIKKGFFQFFENRLYSIIIVLDTNKMDYYTVFSQLSNRYGKFTTLSPSRVLWDTEFVSLSLEQPLTIRYLDKQLQQQFLEESSVEKSKEQIKREDFLDLF